MTEESFKLEFLPQKEEEEQVYIDRIQVRIEELQNQDLNLLFSYLYRLDIEEKKILEIINHTGQGFFARELAKEIWFRQKERMKFKKDFPVSKIKDNDLEF
ncbi:MAG: hypothetical protein ABIO44_09415 [Saprospiraceae bacterium]